MCKCRKGIKIVGYLPLHSRLLWQMESTQRRCFFDQRKLGGHLMQCLQKQNSRSASDNIRTIIEKTESVYVQKFQRLINGTLFSGEFSKSLTSERKAVGAYFASGFIDQ